MDQTAVRKPGDRKKALPKRRRRWRIVLLVALAVPVVCLSIVGGYYYVVFSRLIDERLHGERDHALPRVFGRYLLLRRISQGGMGEIFLAKAGEIVSLVSSGDAGVYGMAGLAIELARRKK